MAARYEFNFSDTLPFVKAKRVWPEYALVRHIFLHPKFNYGTL